MDQFTKVLNFQDNLGITKEDKEFKSYINKKSLEKYNKPGLHYRPHTKVELFTDEDGEMKLKWSKSNMMVLAGGGFLARALFDLDSNASEITPSYNSELLLDKTINSSSAQTAPIKVFGFCVGTDGCGRENSQVFAPKYASWISPRWTEQYGGIVPIAYREESDDLTAEERRIYFGRKTLNGYFAYYFKTADSSPVFTQQYSNGTPIDSNVYYTDTDLAVETVVTLQYSIDKSDVRGSFYYGVNGQTINDCRINTMSLVMGWPNVASDGYTYYQDIRPVTRLNFPNESLIDLRKSILIRYSLYF